MLTRILFDIPFDQIEASQIDPAMDALLAESRAGMAEIAVPKPRTWANTMEALDHFTEKLDYAFGVVRHLESVATTPELRAAFNAVQPRVSEFYSSLLLDEGLWSAVKSFAETEEAKALTGTRKRYLVKTIDAFKRQGAELGPEGKGRLKEIDVALAQVTTKFSENVLDSTNEWELILTDEAKLAGLPPSAVSAARASAESKGKEGWRFTLQAPSYLPLMTYLDDGEIRAQAYMAFAIRATEPARDNRPLVVEILNLRKEKAKLLGFADFADLILGERMAKTGAAALAFVESLHQKTRGRFVEENAELEAFAKGKVEPWDAAYWAEKQRVALYAFDEEELRPYFPLDRVMPGMFELFGKLFGIRVVEEKGVPGWDKEVRRYAIFDATNTDLHLGSFYADWYPRENKRGGAWMDSLITGYPDAGQAHLGLICGNLTPPVDGKPALLTHREVETIFHEFGHLLHHCLSRVEVRSLAGTSVPWDFVELPSQIMENWCWERAALDLFAKHYQTGAPIPEELFEKMVRAKNFRAANAQMRQLGFATVDLTLHREYDPARDGDVIAYARNLLQTFSSAPLPREHAMIAAFTHLFASPVAYGAGYYSYKWAEVLDADAFTRFKKEGVFSDRVGQEYRRRILEKGDSEDPADLYRSFMGRDPDPNALLERAGLA
ncbi:MAG: M3 family metallopeptidase [Bryobacteraceae bacterium]